VASPSGNAASRRVAWEWALIFVALLIAYAPALRGTLLWDDVGHITRPDLRSAWGLVRIWTELGATQQYYPLLHSAFWLEHRLWGDSPLGYHLVNVALHSVSAVLVVGILRRLGVAGALLAGWVFALHPVMVESVAWISEQKNTLSAVFYLASAYSYLTFDDTRRRWRYALASVLFVAALLSKTVAATLPASLLTLMWWRRQRLEWRRDVAPLVPWFATAAIAGAFTALFERELIGARGADFSFSVIERCLIAGRALWSYLATLLWPLDLVFSYPRWTIDATAWWQYGFPVSAVAMAVLLLRFARRSPAPLAGYLHFVATLLPVLGFLNVYPFRFSFVADHFQYLASLGVIVPITAGATVASRRVEWKQAGRVAAVLLVVSLGALTWRQSRIYRDAETLWRDTLARNPASWLAYVNLGAELAAQQRLPEAIAALERGRQMRPDYEPALHDLVSAHLLLGAALGTSADTAAEGLAHVAEALRLNPNDERAHLGHGNLLLAEPGRRLEAIAEFETAVRLAPDYFLGRYNLGTALLAIPDRRADAIRHLEAAVRIEPRSPEAHVNLAAALVPVPERVPDAIAHLESALALRPDLAQARELVTRLRAAAAAAEPK
jgi:tetratricopeptide (TPR) repeat protein